MSDFNIACGGSGELSLKDDLDKSVIGLQNSGQYLFHQQYGSAALLVDERQEARRVAVQFSVASEKHHLANET